MGRRNLVGMIEEANIQLMQLREQMQEVERLRVTVDKLAAVVADQTEEMKRIRGGTRDTDVIAAFATMTPRMHRTLIAVIRGDDNQTIARNEKVALSTAKSYVRTVALKLKVKTRAEIVTKALPTLNDMSDAEYTRISGGVWKSEGEYTMMKEDA